MFDELIHVAFEEGVQELPEVCSGSLRPGPISHGMAIIVVRRGACLENMRSEIIIASDQETYVP